MGNGLARLRVPKLGAIKRTINIYDTRVATSDSPYMIMSPIVERVIKVGLAVFGNSVGQNWLRLSLVPREP